ncbi:MAG: hypothetical protein M0C28_34695 [Candidatus Moduliflexus flocculans]|nr:hypothetical protein [Candidatus Moduliflexus flocculans]
MIALNPHRTSPSGSYPDRPPASCCADRRLAGAGAARTGSAAWRDYDLASTLTIAILVIISIIRANIIYVDVAIAVAALELSSRPLRWRNTSRTTRCSTMETVLHILALHLYRARAPLLSRHRGHRLHPHAGRVHPPARHGQGRRVWAGLPPARRRHPDPARHLESPAADLLRAGGVAHGVARHLLGGVLCGHPDRRQAG